MAWSRFAYAAFGFAAILTVASPAWACGYHNPSDVALGMMNWTYPRSLYVRTAVWQAEDAGILPPRAQTPIRDLFAFNRMTMRLQELGDNLNAAGLADGDRASFAVVHLDSMLWTRFERTKDGYAIQAHATGPSDGDAVVVTHGKVIAALVDGTLDAERAEAHGLLRYYGPRDTQAIARKALVAASAELSKTSGGSPVRSTVSIPTPARMH